MCMLLLLLLLLLVVVVVVLRLQLHVLLDWHALAQRGPSRPLSLHACSLTCCAPLPPQPLAAGLVDENQKVKTITALTISALAEAAAPYGIESFDDVLEPLW